MNTPQLAATALRQARKAGLTIRVDHSTTPVLLRVGPKGRLAALPWLRSALTLCKAEVIALLEAETAATPRGTSRCPQCGAWDWAVVGQAMDTYGKPMHVWGCLTCRAAESTLKTALEEAVLEHRWGTTTAVNHSV
jgi:hypothetical protein